MMKKKLMLPLTAGVLTLAFAVSARAQTPPPAESSPPTAARSSGGGSGGAGLGVGASIFFSGLAGADVVYDQPVWHIEGLLAFQSTRGGGMNPPRVTTFDVGVSGWYHLHTGTASDFSLGGGVGFVSQSGGGTSLSQVVLEPGAEIRAFVTPNVAVGARLGLAFLFGDNINANNGNTSILLGAQAVGAIGLTYFFR
jgi:hypothetical protein